MSLVRGKSGENSDIILYALQNGGYLHLKKQRSRVLNVITNQIVQKEIACIFFLKTNLKCLTRVSMFILIILNHQQYCNFYETEKFGVALWQYFYEESFGVVRTGNHWRISGQLWPTLAQTSHFTTNSWVRVGWN